MSTELLVLLVAVPAYVVVLALFWVMWVEHRSPGEQRMAIVAGIVLAAWAGLATGLAWRGAFIQQDANEASRFGINLLVVLIGLIVALSSSRSLRSLLSNQKNLIRLNVWRLVGLVFLLLMADGQVPAVWALPAGIGDILVGLAAFPIAGRLDAPGGRRRAIIFNLLGLADLVVAIGLGFMTSPGPVQLLKTTPTSEILTRFPMALVPGFLVPLAIMLHVVSLRQLFAGSWRKGEGSRAELLTTAVDRARGRLGGA